MKIEETQTSRRTLLKKMLLAIAGLSVFSFSFKNKTEIKSSKRLSLKKGQNMSSPSILKIAPLSFQWETADPFLFCVHHEDFYPKGNDEMGPKASLDGRNLGQDFQIKDGWRMYHGQRIPGFPEHPHRGFETVTVVRKGLVDHADSLGAAGRYGGGDVQWMTAGEGIQHSEMFPLLNKEKENTLELFQIWINLPSVNKFVKPHFKMLWADEIPTVKVKDNQGKKTEITLIAGSLNGEKLSLPPPNSWAADPKNAVAIWTIRMEKGARWELPKAELGVNRALYFFKGEELEVDNTSVANYHKVQLDATKTVQLENGNKEGELLLLQGRPIAEPVAQYGPFVMNTQDEIQQAFQDYQRTRFGGWPWPSSDPVHGKKGRFARHADGREESRSG